jgi:cell wall-associated NlpC family hydrolase
MTDPTDTVRVRAAICPLHGEARVSSPQVSQALRGHPLTVLAMQGDWRQVRGLDGYEGWAHRGFLDEEPDEGAWAGRRLSLGCTVLGPHGAMALPLGALVRGDEDVVRGEAVPIAEWEERHPPRVGAVLESAERYFAGTSYQWGGTTPWGADCSGFTQRIHLLHHRVHLPRDAWQQAELAGAGWSAVDGGLDALEGGDLLFFSDRDDRRITHVGLASGTTRMMHLALGRGGWAHERLEDTADPYVRALRTRFTGALRPRG